MEMDVMKTDNNDDDDNNDEIHRLYIEFWACVFDVAATTKAAKQSSCVQLIYATTNYYSHRFLCSSLSPLLLRLAALSFARVEC